MGRASQPGAQVSPGTSQGAAGLPEMCLSPDTVAEPRREALAKRAKGTSRHQVVSKHLETFLALIDTSPAMASASQEGSSKGACPRLHPSPKIRQQ